MTRFKIHPLRGTKEYYDIRIFDDKLSMKQFSRETFGSFHNFEAACHSYVAYLGNKKKRSNNIGTIIFYKNGFGPGMIAHELSHAVNYYFNRRRVKLNFGGKPDKNWREGEEVYTTILGYMVNQFYKKYKGKINKNEKY